MQVERATCSKRGWLLGEENLGERTPCAGRQVALSPFQTTGENVGSGKGEENEG